MKYILWILIFGWPFKVLANINCGQRMPVVFFSNGMFNTRIEANKSAEELLKFLIENNLQNKIHNSQSVQLAYNESEPVHLQILEVVEQNFSSELIRFFYMLAHPSHAPEALQKKVAEIQTQALNSFNERDSDLRIHVEDYKRVLERNPILVVAHSQGNQYANLSYSTIKESALLDKMMQIQAVATPNSFVSGGGYYSTLTTDGVIRPLKLSLKANVSNSVIGFFDHEFVSHYLKGDKSGPQIYEQIKDALTKFDYPSTEPPLSDEDGFYSEDLLPVLRWVNQRLKDPKQMSVAECLLARTFGEFHHRSSFSCKDRNFANLKDAVVTCRQVLRLNGKDSGDPEVENAKWNDMHCPYFMSLDFEQSYFYDFPQIHKHPECIHKTEPPSRPLGDVDLNEADALISSIAKTN